MRESTGAMMLFGICLTFIIMMTAYLAISVNYAKAFRVKSHLVSMIEEHEGYSPTIDEDVVNYLENQGYTARGYCEENLPSRGYDESWEFQTCLDKTMSDTSKFGPTKRARYKVMTFFKFDIPVVGSMLTFQVAGESRYLFNFAG